VYNNGDESSAFYLVQHKKSIMLVVPITNVRQIATSTLRTCRLIAKVLVACWSHRFNVRLHARRDNAAVEKANGKDRVSKIMTSVRGRRRKRRDTVKFTRPFGKFVGGLKGASCVVPKLNAKRVIEGLKTVVITVRLNRFTGEPKMSIVIVVWNLQIFVGVLNLSGVRRDRTRAGNVANTTHCVLRVRLAVVIKVGKDCRSKGRPRSARA